MLLLTPLSSALAVLVVRTTLSSALTLDSLLPKLSPETWSLKVRLVDEGNDDPETKLCCPLRFDLPPL